MSLLRRVILSRIFKEKNPRNTLNGVVVYIVQWYK